MKKTWRCGKGWFGKLAFAAALGLSHNAGLTWAQEQVVRPTPATNIPAIAEVAGPQVRLVEAAGTGSCATSCAGPSCDACAPSWCDPVSRVPNFLGNFAAQGLTVIGAEGQPLFASSLANPAGGGLAGRNNYFDNGSAIPRDRAYLFYNHVGDVNLLGPRFDVNRYVFGVEKTFLCGNASIEVRLPFAGTANSSQSVGDDLSVDHGQFGNIGIALKGVIYRTPCMVVSVGLGISIPTADDSRLQAGDVGNLVTVENNTWLIQPMIAAAWAPNNRFYTQLGVQFDIATSGNPVNVVDVFDEGSSFHAGTLHDRGYLFTSAAAGYWIYQNNCACNRVSAVALQSELHYNTRLGHRDTVVTGNELFDLFTSADTGHDDSLTTSFGAIVKFGERATFSFGVNVPLSDRQYDWNLIAQLNYQFGGRR